MLLAPLLPTSPTSLPCHQGRFAARSHADEELAASMWHRPRTASKPALHPLPFGAAGTNSRAEVAIWAMSICAEALELQLMKREGWT